MILESWEKYKKIISGKFSSLIDSLNIGTDDEEINTVEEKMKIVFPKQLKELYKANNGDNYEMLCGFIMGFHFYSLEEMYGQWSSWKEIYDGDYQSDRNTFDMFAESSPEGCIKKQYINLKWIPICGDDSGNHIGIDLDPDVNGTIGQVINFGRDEDKKFVIANDLKAFIDRISRIAESEHFSVNMEDFEEDVIILSLPEQPEISLTDYLKDENSIH